MPLSDEQIDDQIKNVYSWHLGDDDVEFRQGEIAVTWEILRALNRIAATLDRIASK